MSFNLLAISAGNTRTRVGVFVDGKLTASHELDNLQPGPMLQRIRDAFGSLRNLENPNVLLASVNPPVAQRIAEDLTRDLVKQVFRVEKDLPIPIGRQLDPEALVGDDRLLNAAAAYDRLKQACVVVDAGTAITVDFIDGAGTFHGGAIAPGAQLMLTALHEHTAQLPEVQFAQPEEPIGHNTIQAMRTGVFYGLRGLVRELVEQYAEVAGSYPMVVATGGNASALFEGYELVERIVPELTLLGLAATWRKSIEEDQSE